MNIYSVFKGGRKDENGNYVGGELVLTTKSERKAFEKERDLNFKYPHDFGIYILRQGDEVFDIVEAAGWWHVTDKSTHMQCYGSCRTEQEAIEHKAWCEKYHTLRWYFD